MYALAINGSPHMEKGNTEMILGPLVEGMKEAGADVEILYTRKLKIAPCSGDMSCWFGANPGECAQKDDMQAVLPKIKKADILVWASPVYYSGVTGQLKNLMDRQLPLHSFGEDEAGGKKKIVLVSTCGAWELSMFDPLLAQMKALYTRPDSSSDFAGALLRPHAEVMKELMMAGETAAVDGVFSAAKEAGRQLVVEGRISEEVLSKVSRPLMPQDAYYKAAEERFRQAKEAMKG